MKFPVLYILYIFYIPTCVCMCERRPRNKLIFTAAVDIRNRLSLREIKERFKVSRSSRDID